MTTTTETTWAAKLIAEAKRQQPEAEQQIRLELANISRTVARLTEFLDNDYGLHDVDMHTLADSAAKVRDWSRRRTEAARTAAEGEWWVAAEALRAAATDLGLEPIDIEPDVIRAYLANQALPYGGESPTDFLEQFFGEGQPPC